MIDARTLGAVLMAADCDGVLPVRAVTPHGTFTFSVRGCAVGDAEVLLHLEPNEDPKVIAADIARSAPVEEHRLDEAAPVLHHPTVAVRDQHKGPWTWYENAVGGFWVDQLGDAVCDDVLPPLCDHTACNVAHSFVVRPMRDPGPRPKA